MIFNVIFNHNKFIFFNFLNKINLYNNNNSNKY